MPPRSRALDRRRQGGALSEPGSPTRTRRFNDCGASWGAAVRVPRRACSSSKGSACCGQAVAAGWEVEGVLRRAGRVASTARRARRRRARAGTERDGAGRLDRVTAADAGRRARCAPAPLPDAADASCSSPIASPIPGNAGTIIRSAEAAGADAVVLTPGSVDPLQPEGASGPAPARCSASRSSRQTLESLSGFRRLGTSSHRGDAVHRPGVSRAGRRRGRQRGPRARRRRSDRPVDHASLTPGRPRASTWRWPRPCSYSKWPGSGALSRMSRMVDRRFRCPRALLGVAR